MYTYIYIYIYMDVSKNRGGPQNGWFIMEKPIKIHDFGSSLEKLKEKAFVFFCDLNHDRCLCSSRKGEDRPV